MALRSLLSLLIFISGFASTFGSSELVDRDAVCLSGSTVTSIIITTNIVIYPVEVNQYYGSNTVVVIGGGIGGAGGLTISVTNAPTTLITTVTATKTMISTSTVAPTTSSLAIAIDPAQDAIMVPAAAVINLTNGGSVIFPDGGVVTLPSGGTITDVAGNTVRVSAGQIVGVSAGATVTVSAGGVIILPEGGLVSIPIGGNVAFPGGDVVTITATNSLTTTATTAATASGVSVTSVPTPFLLQIVTPVAAKRNKRQVSTVAAAELFLAAESAANVDCGSATAFTLLNGNLFGTAGQVSTTSGAVEARVEGSTPVGPITSLFSLVDGELRWTNSAFLGGSATFCVMAGGSYNGTVLAILGESTEICTTIRLQLYETSSCATYTGGGANDDSNSSSSTATGISSTMSDSSSSLAISPSSGSSLSSEVASSTTGAGPTSNISSATVSSTSGPSVVATDSPSLATSSNPDDSFPAASNILNPTSTSDTNPVSAGVTSTIASSDTSASGATSVTDGTSSFPGTASAHGSSTSEAPSHATISNLPSLSALTSDAGTTGAPSNTDLPAATNIGDSTSVTSGATDGVMPTSTGESSATTSTAGTSASELSFATLTTLIGDADGTSSSLSSTSTLTSDPSIFSSSGSESHSPTSASPTTSASTSSCTIPASQQSNDVSLILAVLQGDTGDLLGSLSLSSLTGIPSADSTLGALQIALEDSVECALNVTSSLQICVTDTTNLASGATFVACLANALSTVTTTAATVLADVNDLVAAATDVVNAGVGATVDSTIDLISSLDTTVNDLLNTLLSTLGITSTPVTTGECSNSTESQDLIQNLIKGGSTSLLGSVTLADLELATLTNGTTLGKIEDALENLVNCGLDVTIPELLSCVTNSTNLATPTAFVACLLDSLVAATDAVGTGLISNTLSNVLSAATGIDLSTTLADLSSLGGVVGTVADSLIDLLGLDSGNTTSSARCTDITENQDLIQNLINGGSDSLVGAITLADLQLDISAQTNETTLGKIESALENVIDCGLNVTVPELLSCITNTTNLETTVSFVACLLDSLDATTSAVGTGLIGNTLTDLLSAVTGVDPSTTLAALTGLGEAVGSTVADIVDSLLGLLGLSGGNTNPATTTTSASSAPSATCTISPVQTALLNGLVSADAEVFIENLTSIELGLGPISDSSLLTSIEQALEAVVACGLSTALDLQGCVTNITNTASALAFTSCLLSGLTGTSELLDDIASAVNNLADTLSSVAPGSTSTIGDILDNSELSVAITPAVATLLSLLGLSTATATATASSTTSAPTSSSTCVVPANETALIAQLLSGNVQDLLNSLTISELGSGQISDATGTTLAQIQTALEDVVRCGLDTAGDLLTCVTSTTNTESAGQFAACLLASLSPTGAALDSVLTSIDAILNAVALGGVSQDATVGSIGSGTIIGGLIDVLTSLLTGTLSSTTTSATPSLTTISSSTATSCVSAENESLLQSLSDDGLSLFIGNLTLADLEASTSISASTFLASIAAALSSVEACGTGQFLDLTGCVGSTNALTFTTCIINVVAPVQADSSIITTALEQVASLATSLGLSGTTTIPSLETNSIVGAAVSAIIGPLVVLLNTGVGTSSVSSTAVPTPSIATPTSSIVATPTCSVSATEVTALSELVSGGAISFLESLQLSALSTTVSVSSVSALQTLEDAITDITACPSAYALGTEFSSCAVAPANDNALSFIACLINTLVPGTTSVVESLSGVAALAATLGLGSDTVGSQLDNVYLSATLSPVLVALDVSTTSSTTSSTASLTASAIPTTFVTSASSSVIASVTSSIVSSVSSAATTSTSATVACNNLVPSGNPITSPLTGFSSGTYSAAAGSPSRRAVCYSYTISLGTPITLTLPVSSGSLVAGQSYKVNVDVSNAVALSLLPSVTFTAKGTQSQTSYTSSAGALLSLLSAGAWNSFTSSTYFTATTSETVTLTISVSGLLNVLNTVCIDNIQILPASCTFATAVA